MPKIGLEISMGEWTGLELVFDNDERLTEKEVTYKIDTEKPSAEIQLKFYQFGCGIPIGKPLQTRKVDLPVQNHQVNFTITGQYNSRDRKLKLFIGTDPDAIIINNL